MASKVGNIVFYADNPVALSNFWSDVLGYPRSTFPPELREQLKSGGLTDADFDTRGLAEDPTGEGPRLFFHHASGPKSGRNRLHLDIRAAPGRHATHDEIEAEKDRVVDLGATVVRLIDQQWGGWPEYYYQMQDPEGNEFCIQ